MFGKAIVAAALAMTLGPAARAGVVYSNGSPDGTGVRINSNTSGCPSPTGCPTNGDGWTIFNPFTLGASAKITGFTYDSNFDTPLTATQNASSADYLSTNWSIWTTSPAAAGAHPAFSGAAILGATSAAGGSSSIVEIVSQDARVTVSGLNDGLGINLLAGQYWIGFQNNLNNLNAFSDYVVVSEGSAALQIDNLHQYFSADLQPAAFTIDGTIGAGIPELPTWWLMLLGFGGMGIAVQAAATKTRRAA